MFDDELIRAIRRKIAPDEMTALRDADVATLLAPMDRVVVPLRADVKVAAERGLADFCIDATLRGDDPGNWLSGRQYFSTRILVSARDRAALVEYVFDKAKRDFIRALADGELKRLLGEDA